MARARDLRRDFRSSGFPRGFIDGLLKLQRRNHRSVVARLLGGPFGKIDLHLAQRLEHGGGDENVVDAEPLPALESPGPKVEPGVHAVAVMVFPDRVSISEVGDRFESFALGSGAEDAPAP